MSTTQQEIIETNLRVVQARMELLRKKIENELKLSTNPEILKKSGNLIIKTSLDYRINALKQITALNLRPDKVDVVLKYNIDEFNKNFDLIEKIYTESQKSQIAVLKQGTVSKFFDRLLGIFGRGKKASANKLDKRLRNAWDEFERKIRPFADNAIASSLPQATGPTAEVERPAAEQSPQKRPASADESVAPEGLETPADESVAPEGLERPTAESVAPEGLERPASADESVAPEGLERPASAAESVAPEGLERPAAESVALSELERQTLATGSVAPARENESAQPTSSTPLKEPKKSTAPPRARANASAEPPRPLATAGSLTSAGSVRPQAKPEVPTVTAATAAPARPTAKLEIPPAAPIGQAAGPARPQAKPEVPTATTATAAPARPTAKSEIPPAAPIGQAAGPERPPAKPEVPIIPAELARPTDPEDHIGLNITAQPTKPEVPITPAIQTAGPERPTETATTVAPVRPTEQATAVTVPLSRPRRKPEVPMASAGEVIQTSHASEPETNNLLALTLVNEQASADGIRQFIISPEIAAQMNERRNPNSIDRLLQALIKKAKEFNSNPDKGEQEKQEHQMITEIIKILRAKKRGHDGSNAVIIDTVTGPILQITEEPVSSTRDPLLLTAPPKRSTWGPPVSPHSLQVNDAPPKRSQWGPPVEPPANGKTDIEKAVEEWLESPDTGKKRKDGTPRKTPHQLADHLLSKINNNELDAKEVRKWAYSKNTSQPGYQTHNSAFSKLAEECEKIIKKMKGGPKS